MLPPRRSTPIPSVDQIREDGEGPSDDERVIGHVSLARTTGTFEFIICQCIIIELINGPARPYPSDLDALAAAIEQPNFTELTRRFLYDQLHPHSISDSIDMENLPFITSPISVLHSAIATLYAPSDESGIHGMRWERIRLTSSWRNGPPRHDWVFVVDDEDRADIQCLSVVRFLFLFSFRHNGVRCPRASVRWFEKIGRSLRLRGKLLKPVRYRYCTATRPRGRYVNQRVV